MKNDRTHQQPAWSESWYPIDDRVMGGISESLWTRLPNGSAVFSGMVSLESGGGFCSVRSSEREWGFGECRGITVNLSGDGKTYKIAVRTVHDDNGESYQAQFRSQPGTCVQIDIPWSEFRLMRRGRAIPDGPALDPARISTVGFLIGERQSGPFEIVVSILEGLK